jgi:uncharacterized membrane protein YphA (DoxX/SURF4 family)
MAKGSDITVKTAAAGITVIRIFLGLFFLLTAITKVLPPEGIPSDRSAGNGHVTAAAHPSAKNGGISAQPFIEELKLATGPGGDVSSKASVLPIYADFLRNDVSPHAEFFGGIVIIGEALVGLLLLIGLLTRVAAVFGMILSAAYLLATMHLFPPVSLAGNASFLVMELVVLIGNAGKVIGFDALLGRKKGR